jgi:hypothetical protein
MRQTVWGVEYTRQTAQRTADLGLRSDDNPKHSIYPNTFTGIPFGIDSFLATHNADHSALGEGVPS